MNGGRTEVVERAEHVGSMRLLVGRDGESARVSCQFSMDPLEVAIQIEGGGY